jgi:hypothetical protein
MSSYTLLLHEKKIERWGHVPTISGKHPKEAISSQLSAKH